MDVMVRSWQRENVIALIEARAPKAGGAQEDAAAKIPRPAAHIDGALNKCHFVSDRRGCRMTSIAHRKTDSDETIAQARNRLVRDQARAAGLLGLAKNARISGRVSASLIAAAKRRAHVESDTELLEIALSRLALEDDFGVKLVRRKGSILRAADLDV